MHTGYLLHLHSRLTHTHNCPTIHRHLLVGGWPLLKVAWLGWESAQRDGVSHGSGHFVPLQHSAVSYPFLTTWCGFVPPTGEAKHSSKWRQTLWTFFSRNSQEFLLENCPWTLARISPVTLLLPTRGQSVWLITRGGDSQVCWLLVRTLPTSHDSFQYTPCLPPTQSYDEFPDSGLLTDARRRWMEDWRCIVANCHDALYSAEWAKKASDKGGGWKQKSVFPAGCRLLPGLLIGVGTPMHTPEYGVCMGTPTAQVRTLITAPTDFIVSTSCTWSRVAVAQQRICVAEHPYNI